MTKRISKEFRSESSHAPQADAENKPEGFAIRPNPNAPPIAIFRCEDFAREAKAANLTEEEVEAYLYQLWLVTKAFVQRGWGIHPIQTAIEENANTKLEFEDKV